MPRNCPNAPVPHPSESSGLTVLTIYHTVLEPSKCNCPWRNCENLLGISRRKALMAHRVRWTTRSPSSRLVSVLICLCVATLLPPPQLALSTWAESAGGECPCQKDRERSDEELAVSSSARRLNDRRHSDHSRPHETCDRLHQVASYASRLPAKVGHHLANCLCAPLLI